MKNLTRSFLTPEGTAVKNFLKKKKAAVTQTPAHLPNMMPMGSDETKLDTLHSGVNIADLLRQMRG